MAILPVLPQPEQLQASRPCFPALGEARWRADADFILGGLLLDCKATTHPRKLGRQEIYQLAGYLLLDYDDEFGIDRVGFYLSRQGGLITGDAAEFLHRLGSTTPLARLRHQLHDHLHSAANQHASLPPTPPPATQPGDPAPPATTTTSVWSRLLGR